MELARRIGVSYPRVNEIVKGKRGITPDTALRLARLFNMYDEFWLGLQQGWDVWHALHSDYRGRNPEDRAHAEGQDLRRGRGRRSAQPLAAD